MLLQCDEYPGRSTKPSPSYFLMFFSSLNLPMYVISNKAVQNLQTGDSSVFCIHENEKRPDQI